MPSTAPPIRDAASLIIIDESPSMPRVLLGRRRSDQVFLPNKYVFPGGRVEREDGTVPTLDELSAPEIDKLLTDVEETLTLAHVRGFPLAAIRETYEETGILIGEVSSTPATEEDTLWQHFLYENVYPRLEPLFFFARAITPPGRPRRYDTRFFCVDSKHIAKKSKPRDNELRDITWFTVEDACKLETANITRIILTELAGWLNLSPCDRKQAPAPFFYEENNIPQRRLLVPASSQS